MKPENQSNEKPLIAAIRACLSRKEMTVHEAADELGISHIHLSSMLNGVRRFSGLSQDKQDRLAAFLGMKKSEMFVLAGMLSPEDLLPDHSQDRVEAILQQIQNDPEFRMFSMCEGGIDSTPERIKLLIAVLYEKAITAALQAKAGSLTACEAAS